MLSLERTYRAISPWTLAQRLASEPLSGSGPALQFCDPVSYCL